MRFAGGMGHAGSTAVNGPSSDEVTAVIVPRMQDGTWNGVPHWLGGGTAGTLSDKGSNCVTSLRFPPVSDAASGMPWPSVRTWCLLPGRARSTGLGPLSGRAVPP